MFEHIPDLREPLLTARLLREEILAQPVLPDASERLRSAFLAANAVRPGRAALDVALEHGRRPGFAAIDREALVAIARAAGGEELRTHPGAAFHGKAAPPPSRVAELLDELLETVNSPTAMESWSAVVRAFAVHFLLRLVQPFQASAAAVGCAAEAMVLAADGFGADHMLLAEADAGVAGSRARPDPDAFALERAHRLVERLGESRDLVRDAGARSLLAAWAERRAARLNPRERRLVRWLAEKDGAPRIEFSDYVALHAGRRAPSVRSLQRDFQRLRERGILRADGDAFVLDHRPLAFGT